MPLSRAAVWAPALPDLPKHSTSHGEPIEWAPHAEPAAVEHMRVDHVPEQFLNRANVEARLEQMRRERMPPLVRLVTQRDPSQRYIDISELGNDLAAIVGTESGRTFLGACREAMPKVRDGVLGVLFPRGTWRMHREFGFENSTS